MPVISPQTKAIYDKAARSAANRRARLLREKAASLALQKARSTVVTPTTTTTSSPLRVSRGNQQLRQNKARLTSEQEARTRDRITYYKNFNQQQPRTAISVVTSFLCTYWGLLIIYLGLVLLS